MKKGMLTSWTLLSLAAEAVMEIRSGAWPQVLTLPIRAGTCLTDRACMSRCHLNDLNEVFKAQYSQRS
jgi:hypothetical protein